jgi:hypothetical protein
MRNHLITKDFKDCTLMAEYADLLHSSRAISAVADVNTDYKATISAVSGDHARREIWPRDQCCRSPSRQGRAHRKTPSLYQDDSEVCFYHNTYSDKARKCKPGCQWVGNGQATRTKRFQWRHDLSIG